MLLQLFLRCCGLINRNHRNQQQNLPIRNLAPIQNNDEGDNNLDMSAELRDLESMHLELGDIPAPELSHEQKTIITEFKKLITGEIDEVNIPKCCNRSTIKTMIETTINDCDYNIADLYAACKAGVVSDEVRDFLKNLAKYATTGLSTDPVDIKMTKEQLCNIIDINNIYGNNLTITAKNAFNDAVQSMNFYGVQSSEVAKHLDDMHYDTDERGIGFNELLAKQRAKDVPQFDIDKFREKHKNKALQNQEHR